MQRPKFWFYDKKMEQSRKMRTLRHSVSFVVNVAVEAALGVGRRVVLGTVGAHVLHWAVREYLVVYIRWKLLLIKPTNFHDQIQANSLTNNSVRVI